MPDAVAQPVQSVSTPPVSDTPKGSNLPKAIQEQARKAEELHRQLFPSSGQAGDQAGQGEGEPGAASGDASEAGAASSAPAVGGKTAARQSVEAETQDTSKVREDWKQKYHTLQGKYNAEIPRLQSDNSALQHRLEMLEGILAEMQKGAAQAPAPTAGQAPGAVTDITAEEIDEYGEDLISLVRRIAAKEVQSLTPQIKEVEKKVDTTRQEVGYFSRDQLHQRISAAVPNWLELNNDRNFLDFLAETDLFSGRKKHDLLTEAYNSGDANRVISIFNAYTRQNGQQSAENNVPSPPPTREAQQPGRQVSLDALVAPGAGSGRSQAPTPSDATPIVWTRKRIAEFYNKVQRGAFRSNPEEKNRVERTLFAALRANQVLD